MPSTCVCLNYYCYHSKDLFRFQNLYVIVLILLNINHATTAKRISGVPRLFSGIFVFRQFKHHHAATTFLV